MGSTKVLSHFGEVFIDVVMAEEVGGDFKIGDGIREGNPHGSSIGD